MQEASISLDDGLVLNGVRVLVVEDDG
ncbi:hypothetical protein L611_012200000020, partial [Aminobacter sp. J15]